MENPGDILTSERNGANAVAVWLPLIVGRESGGQTRQCQCESIRSSRKNVFEMHLWMTRAEVYSFRGATGCAKLLGFRRVLQFTVGLRIVICLPAPCSGRAAGRAYSPA